MATNKSDLNKVQKNTAKAKQNTLIDSSLLLTGIVAIASILVISLLADNAIHANLVYEKNPCRLIRCEVAGSPLVTEAQSFGVDPFTGNMRCKCPNESQPTYEVARVRNY
ncbi:hypothetical protein HY484_00565 [Candidatus Woesearchaeota archaeon]|nr:hypothetical protein [Candidatus Woesearchaeota archaeon]